MAPPASTLIPPVRAKLAALGFDAPLTADSVGLVSDLLAALLDEKAKAKKIASTADAQASALFTAEQVGPPLRNEIARLTRENNRLHAAMIELREAAERRAREDDIASSTTQNQSRDLSYLCARLRKTNEELERENAGLREAASRSYEVNGIVLPSGHEVRWHGRKERVTAHSPVAPAAKPLSEEALAADRAPAADSEAHLMPARLVRAAEAQLTALLQRVEASEAAQSELARARDLAEDRAQAREGEAARLGDHLAAALEVGPPAEARRVEQYGHVSRMRQAEGQIDALNSQLAVVGERLAVEQAEQRAARLDDNERARYMDAIKDLRREKLLLVHELERTAGLAGSLGLARPGALAPFVN